MTLQERKVQVKESGTSPERVKGAPPAEHKYRFKGQQTAKTLSAANSISAATYHVEIYDSKNNPIYMGVDYFNWVRSGLLANIPVGEEIKIRASVFSKETDSLGDYVYGHEPHQVYVEWKMTCNGKSKILKKTDPVLAPAVPRGVDTEIDTSQAPKVELTFTVDEALCAAGIPARAPWFAVEPLATAVDNTGFTQGIEATALVGATAYPGTIAGHPYYGPECKSVSAAPPVQGGCNGSVNTATGAFTSHVQDLSTSSPGVPLSLERNYASDKEKATQRAASSAQLSFFGPGWSSPWSMSLSVKESGDVDFHAEDGSIHPYLKQNDSYVSQGLAQSSLKLADGKYVLATPQKESLTFDLSGRLVSHEDSFGRGLTFSYAAGQLAEVTDEAGRKAALGYEDGLLATATLSDGRKSTYTYADGRLATATGSDGVTLAYVYDAAGKMTSVKRGADQALVENVYDASGRVQEQKDARGGKSTFSYQADATNIVAPNGGVWTDVYTGEILTAQYDPFGNRTSYFYDSKLRRTQVRDALGAESVTSYGTSAFPRWFKSASQRQPQVYWSYSGSNLSGYSVDGKKYHYTYDANGKLISSLSPKSEETRYGYDSAGNLSSVTSPTGKKWTSEFDAAGNEMSRTSPEGEKTTFTYYATGQVKTVTDPRGNAEGADSEKFTSTFAYDSAGRILSQKDPKGNTVTYAYDAAGNLEKITDKAGKITSFTYDTADRLTATKDAAGNTSTTTYDAMGNVSARVDVTGAKTTYTYDKAGRVETMTAPRGNVTGADATKYTWKYGYDVVGNQTTVTDPAGNTTKTDYDADRRPKIVTDPLGRQNLTRYDEAGNVAATTDALGKITSYAYDANNQLTGITDRGGKTVTYSYDADGNLTSETSPLGNKTTHAYDGNGRLTRTVEPRGNATGADATLYTWSQSYDVAGNLVGEADPYGNKISRSYDAVGNVTERNDQLGNKTGYAYDERGQLTKVTNPDSGTTVLGYDAMGNMTSRQDANTHTTSYAYDKASRLTKITDPLARVTSYAYDPEGNRTKVTNARGQTVTSTFDALGLLTKSTYSDGTPSATYTYDGAGQTKTLADGTGTRTFTYDPEGRPLSITSPGAANPFKYTYDANGSVKSRTYPDGRAITYAYDDDGRMTGQTAGGKTTTYNYDAAGNLTSTKLPTTTAITQTRTYNRAGLLSSVSEGTGARNFSRDKTGRVIADSFKDATTTGLASRYGYNPAGRLARACTDTIATTSCLTGTGGSTYTYDKVGNLSTASSSSGTRTHTYDAADQLTKHVEGTTTVDFTYDADGNLTKDKEGTYAYDALSRVKSATIGADSFTFVYDADGNRTISNKNGALARTSRWDVVNPLPQIATDTGASGTLLADYHYNPHGIAESKNRTTGTFYFTHDRQDSVTAVHDSTGKKTYDYSYSAWGVSTGKASVTGGESSIFGYTGQYKDQYLTGRLSLRDRSYDPGNRRFTTTDPVPAGNDSPNLSPYAYANNDPVNQSDPSGRCPLCISAGIGAAFGAVVEGGIYSWQHRNGGFGWGGLGASAGKGAITGAIGGALMPGVGNAAARGLGLTGARAVTTSTAVNAGVGAGFSWGINQANCRPTDPWDLVFGATGGAASSLIGPALKWMKGSQGGVLGNPFPGLQVPSKAIVSPRTVFRGDGRSPAQVFASGFHVDPMPANFNIARYGTHNENARSVIGTTRVENLGSMFPQSAKGSTWVYEIDAPGVGIDMNKVMGLGYVFRAEREVIFPAISPDRIIRARYWKVGMPTDQVIENPGYRPAG